MSKKSIVLILIVLIAFLPLLFIYSYDCFSIEDSANVKTLSVSSEGPIELSKIISDIESASYYNGYDNETLNWMKSLGDKFVFVGDGIMVIMDSYDAGKLHSEYATDVYILENFECVVLENHSLGDIKYPRNVLLVKNVKYLGDNITYYDV